MDQTQVRALLLDIEGTTTSVDFVYKTLFPYARQRVRAFVAAHLGEPEVAEDIELLRLDHAYDAQQRPDCPALRSESREAELDSVAAYVDWLKIGRAHV